MINARWTRWFFIRHTCDNEIAILKWSGMTVRAVNPTGALFGIIRFAPFSGNEEWAMACELIE